MVLQQQSMRCSLFQCHISSINKRHGEDPDMTDSSQDYDGQFLTEGATDKITPMCIGHEGDILAT